MKNYESPTIESAGGSGEMGTWVHTETWLFDIDVVATRLVGVGVGEFFVFVAIALVIGSPPPEEQTK